MSGNARTSMIFGGSRNMINDVTNPDNGAVLYKPLVRAAPKLRKDRM